MNLCNNPILIEEKGKKKGKWQENSDNFSTKMNLHGSPGGRNASQDLIAEQKNMS